MAEARPAAVLLDLDGTLVDSAPLWQRAYTRLAVEAGVPLLDGWWSRVVGLGLEASVGVLLGATTDRTSQRRWTARLIDHATAELATTAGDDAVTWRPGAARLLDLLATAGVPTAVVTTTPRAVLDAILTTRGITVDLSVAGDEVARPKPDPEGYRRAAAGLGVPTAACVAIEDSPTGVAAAEAAGVAVVVVPHTVPVPSGPGRRRVDTLAEVDLTLLADHAGTAATP